MGEDAASEDQAVTTCLSGLTYVCSSELDHRTLICDDAGPGYAESMGLNWVTTDAVLEKEVESGATLLICNRIRPSELADVVEFAAARPDVLVLAKVVDPRASAFGTRSQMEQLAILPNTAFVTVYEPKEAVEDFLRDIDQRRWAVVPYPYLPWREVESPISNRRRKAVLTGSMDAAVYPLRTALRDLRGRDRVVRKRLDILTHPGYVDLGHPRRHRRIGSEFVEYLSKYQLMFLCGGRSRLQLMKYLECAYAGCAPFGVAPTAFGSDLAALVLPLSLESLSEDVCRVLDSDVADLQARADTYRDLVRSNCSQAIVRAALAGLVTSALSL